ncbi:MAG TPA: aminotransferase class V-fold PLP-dependent enzyme [Candidatus Saccharimonadales bacterium]|nr:aminotransferase class V-fold PLP-dependent enzyme [Candidatus Saccharimonadales bacterium]
MLRPEITFLNHGSFGSCPRPVLEFQQRLRDRMEGEPVQFLAGQLEPLWDQARESLASFVGAAADDLVFVQNATTGLNTVLHSLSFVPEDELLVTNQEYNASRNALNVAAEKWRAKVIVAEIPFPVQSEDQIVAAVLSKVTDRTRLALLDHVVSQTALVLPLHKIVPALRERGVETLIDGAHAPGMIPLNLRELGATYYTGNCHKWICAPKSAGFLHVQREKQKEIRPLVISHGANSPRHDRSRFLIEFSWMGTWDPTPALSVPEALRYIASLHPDGWSGVMAHNHRLALEARALLAAALRISLPCPNDMIGSMAALPLPPSPVDLMATSPLYRDPLQQGLYTQHKIEVPVLTWPSPAVGSALQPRLIRISAQLYNRIEDYHRLASALVQLLKN